MAKSKRGNTPYDIADLFAGAMRPPVAGDVSVAIYDADVRRLRADVREHAGRDEQLDQFLVDWEDLLDAWLEIQQNTDGFDPARTVAMRAMDDALIRVAERCRELGIDTALKPEVKEG